jgi:hypothetical protein
MDVAIVGNFDIKNASNTFKFSKDGWWYDYFQNDSIEVNGAVDFTFSPGEFHVFTSVKQVEVEVSLITFFEARDTIIVQGIVVTVNPKDFQPETEITITFDAAEADGSGTAGLVGAAKVYMHAGIITSSETGTDWQYVIGNWGMDNGLGQMTKVPGEANKWQITLKPKTYFSAVPSNAKWYRIGMVFRNADGSREGKALGGTDIFVNFTEKELLLGTETLKNIRLYPNPSGSFFQIDGIEDIESVRLMDASGRLIQKYASQERYEVENLPSGIYLVAIKTSHKSFTKRLLIN